LFPINFTRRLCGIKRGNYGNKRLVTVKQIRTTGDGKKMGQLSDRTKSKRDKGPWGPMVNSFIPRVPQNTSLHFVPLKFFYKNFPDISINLSCDIVRNFSL